MLDYHVIRPRVVSHSFPQLQESCHTSQSLASKLIPFSPQTDITHVDLQSPSHPSVLDSAAAAVVLSGSLDQYQAESLKSQLLGAIPSAGSPQRELLVDMTAVDHIDACCLQVLLACQAGPEEEKLKIKGAPPSVRQWIRIAGADELFTFQSEKD